MYNAKAKLATSLRKQDIHYETGKDFLKIKTVSLSFFPDLERISFRDCRLSEISFNINYSHPSTLLFNLHRFSQLIDILLQRQIHLYIRNN
jgi:hypothetical protein